MKYMQLYAVTADDKYTVVVQASNIDEAVRKAEQWLFNNGHGSIKKFRTRKAENEELIK